MAKRPPKIGLHGDCHPGNILWTPTDRPAAARTLWTWTTPAWARPCRTCGCCCPATAASAPCSSGPAGRLRAVSNLRPARTGVDRALRTLRLIHYSAWLARRWQDPIFPVNFPWFGSSDYWRGQVDMLQEQIEAMQEEPLDCG
jgi:Ser/Thr protein kinase RdoA (MazF antagonist)